MTTTIKAKKDLYNSGKCFTEGETYTVNGRIITESGLMDCITINDMGEKHRISSWWREFEIVSHN